MLHAAVGSWEGDSSSMSGMWEMDCGIVDRLGQGEILLGLEGAAGRRTGSP